MYALIVQMYASIHLGKHVVRNVYSYVPKLYCVGDSRRSSWMWIEGLSCVFLFCSICKDFPCFLFWFADVDMVFSLCDSCGNCYVDTNFQNQFTGLFLVVSSTWGKPWFLGHRSSTFFDCDKYHAPECRHGACIWSILLLLYFKSWKKWVQDVPRQVQKCPFHL